MKTWYYKLKESNNYNAIILAVLIALVIRLIRSVYVACINVWQVIEWNMLDGSGLFIGGTAVLSLICNILAVVFVVQAIRRDPKMIIGAVASLAVMAVAGVSLCAVNCLIGGGYWFWLIKKPSERTILEHVYRLTMILLAVSVAVCIVSHISSLFTYGLESVSIEVWYAFTHVARNLFNPEVFLLIYLFRHGRKKLPLLAAAIVIAVTLAAAFVGVMNIGHFSEWGPEASVEAGDWSEWETEDGNITYYDNDGNGTTMQEFQFD